MSGPYPPDRRCQEASCITYLSAYNPGPSCWRHSSSETVSKSEHRNGWRDLLDELLATGRIA